MTQPDPYQIPTTRLSDMAQALSTGEPILDRDRSIIAQNAGTTASNLLGQYTGEEPLKDFLDRYHDIRTAVFNGTLALAGAESVVESFEGGPSEAPAQQSSGWSGGGSRGGGAGDVGTLVVKSGKFQGQTLNDINAQDRTYIEWLADKSNNTFLKNKAAEFLAATAA